MMCLVEKQTEFEPDLVNVTNKGRKCPLSMYRQFPNGKFVRAEVFRHKEPSNLTPASFD